MERKTVEPAGPAAKLPVHPKRPSRRGAHWKKFDFGKGVGLKLWQVVISPAKPRD